MARWQKARSKARKRQGKAKKQPRAIKKGKRKPTKRRFRMPRQQRARICRMISRPFLIRHRSSSRGKVDRLATIVAVDGKPTAFYQSTGRGGLARAKSWVPFGGISRVGGGWFIKVPGKLPTGDMKRCSDWLTTKRLKPTKTFDQADYPDTTSHSADINRHLDQHGALSREAGRFQIGTTNIKRSK